MLHLFVWNKGTQGLGIFFLGCANHFQASQREMKGLKKRRSSSRWPDGANVVFLSFSKVMGKS